MSEDELDRRLGEHYARERERAEAPSFDKTWERARREHQRHVDRRRTVWVVSGFAVAAVALLAILPMSMRFSKQVAAPLLLSESAERYGVRRPEPLAFLRDQDLPAALEALRAAAPTKLEATP